MIQAIEMLVLWPRDPQKEPRTLRFNAGRVNVISGYSRTGKSAILSIVDYALLSTECNIPSLIRRAVSHVGVRLATAGGPIMVARTVPLESRQAVSDDDEGDRVFWDDRPQEAPTQVPRLSMTRKEGRLRLDRLSDLPDLPFEPKEEGQPQGFEARPGFRDLTAFLFQPQSLVANANTLFYKADTFKHREKLRNVLPLVLGLTTVDRISAEHQLATLLREHARVLSRVELQNRERQRLRERLESLYLRLREVGVIRVNAEDPTDADTPELARTILAATELVRETGTLSPVGHTSELAADIASEQRRHDDAARQLGDARRKLRLFERMATAASEYEIAQKANLEYLKSFEWLKSATEKAPPCPLCGSSSTAVADHVSEMSLLLSEVSRLGRGAGQVRNNARKSLEEQRAVVLTLESQLSDIRENLRILEEPLKEGPQSFRAVGVLLGEAEFVSRQVVNKDKTADQLRLDELNGQIASLRQQLRGEESGTRERVLRKLQERVSAYAEILEVERASEPATIDVNELMVRVGGDESFEYLPQIGSGANWMGYHVAAMLGLHEQLLSGRRPSPVPSFIFFDQPSQVYFPADPFNRTDDRAEIQMGKAADEDLAGVRRVFVAMTEAVKRTKGRLQIIVTEHAGERVWSGLDVDLIEDWHDGVSKLVPMDWLDEA